MTHAERMLARYEAERRRRFARAALVRSATALSELSAAVDEAAGAWERLNAAMIILSRRLARMRRASVTRS